MKIELIGPSTIKVTIEAEELAFHSLDYNTLDKQSVPTKALLADIFIQINNAFKIDLTDEKIFIEAFPTDKNGAILYISSLSVKAKKNALGDFTIKPSSYSTAYSTIICIADDEIALQKVSNTIYIHLSHIIRDSELYYCNNKYYLIMCCYKRADKRLNKMISEFDCSFSNDEIVAEQCKEHFSCLISENALEILHNHSLSP